MPSVYNALDQFIRPRQPVPAAGPASPGTISGGAPVATAPGVPSNNRGIVARPRTPAAPPQDFFGRARGQFADVANRSRAFEDAAKARVAPSINIGYTNPEKSAMKVATASPIASSFSSAGEQLRNQALMTGSGGTGLAPAMMRMAQLKGQALAPALAGLEGKFADARRDDEKTNVDYGFRHTAQQSSDILNAQGQQAGLAGQESNMAQSELGASENQRNRELTTDENDRNREFEGGQAGLNREFSADQNQRARELQLLGMKLNQDQFNAAQGSQPKWWEGALSGGIGALGQYLGGMGGNSAGAGVNSAIKSAIGAGAGAAGLLGMSGGWVAPNATMSAMLPNVASKSIIGSTTGGGGGGVLGGIGGAIKSGVGAVGKGVAAGAKGIAAGFGAIPVAGQVALGIAGGILLGKKVFGVGNTHEKADDWVNAEQNQMDRYMHEINMAQQNGQITPEQAQQAKQETLNQYIEAGRAYASKGKDHRRVIDQAFDTLRKAYKPEQYNIAAYVG